MKAGVNTSIQARQSYRGLRSREGNFGMGLFQGGSVSGKMWFSSVSGGNLSMTSREKDIGSSIRILYDMKVQTYTGLRAAKPRLV